MLLRILREGREEVILVDCLRRKRRAVVKGPPCYRRAGCRHAGRRRESSPLAWQALVQQSDLGRCRIAQEQSALGVRGTLVLVVSFALICLPAAALNPVCAWFDLGGGEQARQSLSLGRVTVKNVGYKRQLWRSGRRKGRGGGGCEGARGATGGEGASRVSEQSVQPSSLRCV